MPEYRICTQCIMDTSDPAIKFNEKGVCNHCTSYFERINRKVRKGKEGERIIREFVREVKSSKRRKYDCIVGISGGLDSCYTLYYVKKVLGLNPLAVHLDNGWNSKSASQNISKLIKKLGVDLYTYVINWDEFKDIQLSYLKASVRDIEVPTDHAIKSILFKAANQNNVKYIIVGTNVTTEGVLPKSWIYNKSDYINLKDIHRKFGSVPIKTFPILTLRERIVYQVFKNIREFHLLNYLDYNKKKAKEILAKDYQYEDYGGKHRESLFTDFYQSYILPRKFGFDKRRAHLSSLILAGQITRQEALKEVEKDRYTKEDLEKERVYVAKKFDLTEKEFDHIMNLPVRDHYDYKSSDKMLKRLRTAYHKLIFKPFV